MRPNKQDFLTLNPAAKVPVLVDGSLVLTESAAIQLYLADKNPQAGFIPESVEDRAQMYRWIFFLVTEIEQPLWRIARHTFLYPEEKRLPQDVDLARQECMEMVAVLERHMEEREFMVADRLSVADFNAAYTLDWANEEKMLDGTPRLRKYLKSMYARPTSSANHRRGARGAEKARPSPAMRAYAGDRGQNQGLETRDRCWPLSDLHPKEQYQTTDGRPVRA